MDDDFKSHSYRGDGSRFWNESIFKPLNRYGRMWILPPEYFQRMAGDMIGARITAPLSAFMSGGAAIGAIYWSVEAHFNLTSAYYFAGLSFLFLSLACLIQRESSTTTT